MDRPPAQLNYAAPPKSHRWLRHVCQVLLLVSVTVAGIHWGPHAWDRFTLLYVQWRCLRYDPPPDRVVCTETPFAGGAPASFSQSLPDPPELTRLLARSPALAAVPELSSGPLLFMHERRLPHGRPLLVIVRRMPPRDRESIDCPLLYQCAIIEPATWREDAKVVRTCVFSGDTATPGDDVRFFAGQCDSAADAGFQILFEQSGQRGVAAGTLEDVPGSDPKLVIR